jgi:hypothetical protein
MDVVYRAKLEEAEVASSHCCPSKRFWRQTLAKRDCGEKFPRSSAHPDNNLSEMRA